METLLLVLLSHLRLLLLFSVSDAAAGEVNTIHSGCPSMCGKVDIPYPFGIRANCSIPGFELTCNESLGKPFFSNIEFISINLTSGSARINQPSVSSMCYNNSTGSTTYVDWTLYLREGPYRYSVTSNKFITVGCNTLAYIIGDAYVAGCVSNCESAESLAGITSCSSGKGCCLTQIPMGLNYYRVRFDEAYNSSLISHFSRCGYGFLVEEKSFKFDPKYVTTEELQQLNEIPVVVDWAIANYTCEVAQANYSTSYACLSNHSDCVNSTNGPGYRCACSTGYDGNPYLIDGCHDIDECKDPEEYPCYGTCLNSEGSFTCTCRSGTEGDPKTKDGCKKKSKNTRLWLVLVVAGLLCTFALAIFAHHVHERVKLMRVKRKCFQQNGGLLLQEQISAHQGVKFRIFTIEELERATDNFDARRKLGEGGNGLVYSGSLTNGREVAIKKSRLTNQEQKKEFVKEMYIGSLINHRNVVSILGCCLEAEVPFLVYEFVRKGDLFNYIHNNKDPIPLDFRLKVAGESAAALAYLHSDASPPILHGDVKSSNILLDEDYSPKVSDFGASLLDKDELATHAQGTRGYIDPEYVQTCLLTDKSDVYSFAVVLLEIFTRKPVVLSERSGAKLALASVFHSSARENRFRELLDSEIRHELGNEQVEEMAEMLTRCLSPSGESRPAMKEVAAWVERLRNCVRPSTTKPLSTHDLRLGEHNDLKSGESSSFWMADGTKYNNTGSRIGFNLQSGR